MGIPYAEVIGDPIGHSKSPLIHKFWLEKLGLEGDYRKLRVRSDDLAAYLTVRRDDPDWRGCNVTAPHKERIIRLLDGADGLVPGAVNCVVPEKGKLIGYNTDPTGVEYAIDYECHSGPACIIGSGGAAAAAIVVLNTYCVSEFRLIVRQPKKARAMLERGGYMGKVFTFDEAIEAIAGCSVLINATPLGMIGFPPMPAGILDNLAKLVDDRLVADFVYDPLQTALLERARQLGFPIADGLTMLVGQASAAFGKFFKVDRYPGIEPELRELLTR